VERFLPIARLVLPILLAGSAAAIKIHAGQLGLPMVLVVIGGALLGWAAVLLMGSAAMLFGQLPASSALPGGWRSELEREKSRVLRSIKEIELDAALKKIEAEEAARLVQPLRERAMSLLHELDHARLSESPTVEAEIEAELQRRLGLSGEGTR
jgi:hypothetical protein